MDRILHVVTNTGRGGLETMLMNYYRKIDRSEIQFDFLRHRSDHEAYDDEMRELGATIYELPRMNPFSSSYLKKLNAFFEEHKEYKIVHVHQDCMSSVILKAAYDNGVPIRIAHSHSSNQDKNLKYPIKLYFRSKIKKYATHLVACGKEAGKWMFNTDEFDVLNNAINASQYIYSKEVSTKKRLELGINENTLVVGLIARFVPTKNHSFLIDVFEALKKKCSASKLLLVGEGELKKQAQDKVKSMGLDDSVIFTGVRGDVNELLQAMDVFVMPSVYEGLPLSIIEAQAAGLPCVVSKGVSLECAVTPNVRFLSLDEGIDNWCDAIVEMYKIPRENQYDRIRHAGFDVGENAKKLQEFYLSILNKGSK